MRKNPLVGISGNIGVGKTTFAKVISERLSWKVIYESVIDNPYLEDFYSDMNRWSFNLQVYFLYHRFNNQLQLGSCESGVIQDRTIYEDAEIFAKNLYEMKVLSKRDWDTYRNLFYSMEGLLKKPDLIIYLRASTDTLISRINSRDRSFEKTISLDYLHRLNIGYEEWANKSKFNVLILDTDNFNIFNDDQKLDDYINKIKDSL